MSTIASIIFEGGGLRDGDIADGGAVKAEKVIQQYTTSKLLTANDSTAVANISYPLLIVEAPTATIMRFEAAVFTIATGGDRTVTVDLQKSTGGGAFATVCSSTIVFNNASSARVKSPAVLSSTSLAAGDILRTVVTVVGAAGAQALGLLVSLTVQDRLA
jgi:hypothetical protein